MNSTKRLFLSLVTVALTEFAVNHPGTKVSARIMEAAYNVPLAKLNELSEKGISLAEAANDFICYEFTQGKAGFKKPSWL